MKNLYKIEDELYIISDTENINENDYIITTDNRLVQVSYLLSKDLEGASKVILTTNKLLTKDGVQAIDDEFLQWFVKNPSCEKVKVEKFHGIKTSIAEISSVSGNDDYNWQGKSDLRDYKIIIPKQTNENLTTEQIAWKWLDVEENGDSIEDTTSFEKGVEIGAKWKAEKMYSEQDMLNFAWFLLENVGQYSCDKTAHFEGKYLEKFKNK